ncbi:class F sortase [Streptomyces bobili]|uniref:class F sortase n=1 Tax=Streptomyces bobili TaxID=67280 RepID=UPI00365934A9
MAPRRRIRRPWYRTRAYRLTRTAALAVTLVTGAVWWGHAEEPPDTAVLTVGSAGSTGSAGSAGSPGGGVDARAPDGRASTRSGPVASETPREEPLRRGTGLSGPARPPSGAPSPATPAPGTPSARARQPAPGASPARARPSPPGKASAGAGQAPRQASPSRARPTRPLSSPPGPRRPPSASGAASAPGRAGASRPSSRPAPGTPSTGTAKPRTAEPPAAGSTRAAKPRPRPTAQGTAKGTRVLPRSRAARLAIPFLDLDAPVMDLRLDSRRRLPAPPEDDPLLVGWYADGPSPGGPGTAVAVGHLDTDTGPAVFSGLSELGKGRRIEIRRADGRTAVYTVDRIKNYEKSDFPDQEVYGDRGRPELRLITCGGTFDRRSGYSGNLVVFAHLTQIREPTGPPR